MESIDNVRTHGSCVHQSEKGSCVHQPQDGPCLATSSSTFQTRKSPRADFHDYSGGEYFVTICTREKEHFFGKIHDDEMILTEIGEYCGLQLEEINCHYHYAQVLLYVVMPNHIHAIIRIENEGERDELQRTHEPCVPTVRTALSVVIGGFKRAVTMFARRNSIDFGWQSRYHDHIIRGVRDGNKISEYIENNVARWSADCFNQGK